MAAPKMARDIRDYLVNTTGLSPVHIGSLPANVTNAYAVIDFPGAANVKTHGGGLPRLDNANIQIQARHQKEQTALTNIHSVVDALDGLKGVTINSVVYLYIMETSRPRILTRQEDGSVVYVWECRVQSRR